MVQTALFLAPALLCFVPRPNPSMLAARKATPVIGRPVAPISVATLPREGAPAVGADAWTADLDYKEFRKEVNALGRRLADEQGEADIAHLKKMIRWSNACGLVGVATMWMSGPMRLLSILGLSTWTCTRWTMIGHHICHGGYNRQDDPKMGGTGRLTSYGFAVGSVYRRARDWFDWMLPEAWNVEHNNLHHYRLGENGDPDLVERNLELLRTMRLPRVVKYAVVAVMAAAWKWYYYAPNTYKQLKITQMRKAGVTVSQEDAHSPFTLPVILDLNECRKYGTGPIDFMQRVMAPYLLLRFFLLPAPLLLLNRAYFWAAVANLMLADVVSNLHSFIIIATNHCGDDMYKFEGSCTPRSGTFFMRAITSSANFRTSNGVDASGNARPVHGHTADLNDFLHGWLNYQIEHHCWPHLSMLSYQKSAPLLRAICEKHGVPYVQQNVFHRLKKTADIMVGAASMRPFDRSWNYAPDAFTWDDERQEKAAREVATDGESEDWAKA